MMAAGLRTPVGRQGRGAEDAGIDPDASPRVATRTRVMVVEDGTAERLRLGALLEQLGFEVQTAADGAEALERLVPFRPEVVLSDWQMPRVDGLELCRRIRQRDPHRYTYFILLTGREARSDIVDGLDAGADDYLRKPVDSGELHARIRAGLRLLARQAPLEAHNQRLQNALRCEAESLSRIRQDVEAAAEIQRELLPSEVDLPPGIAMGSLFDPVAGVGGDVFGTFELDARYLAFYIADVSGHGIPAAMTSLSVHRAIRDAARGGAGEPASRGRRAPRPVERVVEALNAAFCDTARRTSYFTMIYGVLDRRTGCARLCQAGQPHAILSRADGRTSRLGAGGFPVGLVDTASYDHVEFHLAAGDRLYLYSDGVLDCADARGNVFGLDRLEAYLASSTGIALPQVCARLGELLRGWRRGAEPNDDVSVFAIERAGAGPEDGGVCAAAPS
jgi:sigma-B regulation protein RsbU (phosphoserine phosphatase)